jgi:hypothetical protein
VPGTHVQVQAQGGQELPGPENVFNGSAVIDTSATEFVDHTRKQMEAVWQEARVAQMIAQEESAYYYNKRHGVIRNICQGDKVFVKDLPRTPGEVSTHIHVTKMSRCISSATSTQYRRKGQDLSTRPPELHETAQCDTCERLTSEATMGITRNRAT